MISCLISRIGTISLDSVIIEREGPIAIVEDFSNVNGLLLLEGRAARPRFELRRCERILNLNVHDNDITLIQRYGGTFDRRSEVPARIGLSVFGGNRSIIIIDADRAVV